MKHLPLISIILRLHRGTSSANKQHLAPTPWNTIRY